MNDPRRPIAPDGDRSDHLIEQRVRAWLDVETDRPPDTLAAATIVRARRTGQRPGWLARLRRGDDGRPPRATLFAAATASIAAAALVVSVVWQVSTGPVGNQPSPSSALTSTPSAVASMAPTASSAAPAFDGRAETMLELQQRATALGAGFDSLWLGDEAGQLLRIGPGDATVRGSTELGGVPCGPIVAAALSLWLTTCGTGVSADSSITLRVDPATGLVVNRYEDVGGDGIGASAMGGLVWFVSDIQQGRLTAVDAVTGATVRDLIVGVAIRHMTAGFGSLWVSPIGRQSVLRLDPATGAQQAEVALSGESGYLVTSVDAIWVAEPHQWVVGRIDPVSDRVSAEIGVGQGVSHLELDSAGLLWALADLQAVRIDPTTNQPVVQFPVPAHLALDGIGTHVLATSDESVWFADGLELLRIDAAP